jgi:type I restriction enzyme S subunit
LFDPAAIKPIEPKAVIPSGIEVHDGDILLTRSNTRDRVGDVCIAKNARPRTVLCDLIYRLRLRRGSILPEFLIFQLMSRVGRGQIESDARGSSGTMPKISQSHIKSWRIFVPAPDEQTEIVTAIHTATQPIDTAITRLEREIALLREYRTRLVADVVTGQLDVRPAAPHLPAEPAAAHEGEESASSPEPEEIDLET